MTAWRGGDCGEWRDDGEDEKAGVLGLVEEGDEERKPEEA